MDRQAMIDTLLKEGVLHLQDGNRYEERRDAELNTLVGVHVGGDGKDHCGLGFHLDEPEQAGLNVDLFRKELLFAFMYTHPELVREG